jgi:hypothetical protein
MLEVGCPEPALVDERIASTRNWAATSATVPMSVFGVVIVVMTFPSHTASDSDDLPLIGYPRTAAANSDGWVTRR